MTASGLRDAESGRLFWKKSQVATGFPVSEGRGPGRSCTGGQPVAGVGGGVDHGPPGEARPQDRQSASAQVGRAPFALLWVPMARPPGPIKTTHLWSEPFAWAS